MPRSAKNECMVQRLVPTAFTMSATATSDSSTSWAARTSFSLILAYITLALLNWELWLYPNLHGWCVVLPIVSLLVATVQNGLLIFVYVRTKLVLDSYWPSTYQIGWGLVGFVFNWASIGFQVCYLIWRFNCNQIGYDISTEFGANQSNQINLDSRFTRIEDSIQNTTTTTNNNNFHRVNQSNSQPTKHWNTDDPHTILYENENPFIRHTIGSVWNSVTNFVNQTTRNTSDAYRILRLLELNETDIETVIELIEQPTACQLNPLEIFHLLDMTSWRAHIFLQLFELPLVDSKFVIESLEQEDCEFKVEQLKQFQKVPQVVGSPKLNENLI